MNKKAGDLFQNYIKDSLTLLFENKLISEKEFLKEYSKDTFDLSLPILLPKGMSTKGSKGHGRYWEKLIFDNRFYVCSQWWNQNEVDYKYKIQKWLQYLKRVNELNIDGD